MILVAMSVTRDSAKLPLFTDIARLPPDGPQYDDESGIAMSNPASADDNPVSIVVSLALRKQARISYVAHPSH
jgi:hypothetical protein